MACSGLEAVGDGIGAEPAFSGEAKQVECRLVELIVAAAFRGAGNQRELGLDGAQEVSSLALLAPFQAVRGASGCGGGSSRSTNHSGAGSGGMSQGERSGAHWYRPPFGCGNTTYPPSPRLSNFGPSRPALLRIVRFSGQLKNACQPQRAPPVHCMG
jgi:hypothetical protein